MVWSLGPSGHGWLPEVDKNIIFCDLITFFFFRMSSACALGQKWYFCEDLDKVCINFVGLEKSSRPNRLRSTLKLDNGLPGLQVKQSHYFILFLFILDCFVDQTLH